MPRQQTLTTAEYLAAVRDSWSEAQFRAAVIVLANSLGYEVAGFRSVRVQRADGRTFWQTPTDAQGDGWPDTFLARERDGAKCALELKVKRNKPSADQLKWLRILNACGIPAFVKYPRQWHEIERMLT